MTKNRLKKRFPQDVARFFHPLKSLVIPFDGRRKTINMVQKGTHQYEKSKERSYIIAYNGGGTARKVVDKSGKVTYK